MVICDVLVYVRLLLARGSDQVCVKYRQEAKRELCTERQTHRLLAYRHCEYQSLEYLHVYGDSHVLQPV